MHGSMNITFMLGLIICIFFFVTLDEEFYNGLGIFLWIPIKIIYNNE